MSDFWQTVTDAQNWVMTTFGLDFETARAYAYAAVATWWTTGKWISPTSGYRDPSKQRELYQRWLNGESGISRPARQSWHMAGRAFDVSRFNPEFNTFRAFIAQVPGIRDGSTFEDPGHFDLPMATLPPAAF